MAGNAIPICVFVVWMDELEKSDWRLYFFLNVK